MIKPTDDAKVFLNAVCGGCEGNSCIRSGSGRAAPSFIPHPLFCGGFPFADYGLWRQNGGKTTAGIRQSRRCREKPDADKTARVCGAANAVRCLADFAGFPVGLRACGLTYDSITLSPAWTAKAHSIFFISLYFAMSSDSSSSSSAVSGLAIFASRSFSVLSTHASL